MNKFSHGMFKRQTVPPPVLPSNTKKLAIGGSRPPSALRISCANIPPTIAHTGENSWLAVVDNDSRSSLGALVRTCLFTSASDIREFEMDSSSSVWSRSSGSLLCCDSNCQIAATAKKIRGVDFFCLPLSERTPAVSNSRREGWVDSSRFNRF